MGLLDSLNTGPSHRRKGRCRAAVIIADLPKEEADKIGDILTSIANREGRYTSNWLAQVLTDEGHQINHQTLLRHARRTCCCES